MARGRGGGGDGGGSGFSPNIEPAPLIFTIFYGLLLLYYILKAIKNPTQVFIILSLFCAIRVTAFVIDMAISADTSYEPTLPELITLSFFLSVGFFALLYSAYALVLDREIASGNVVKNPITRVTSNRYLICFALAIAVAIGIATSVLSSVFIQSCVYNDVDMCTLVLHETYVTIFLVITVLMGVQVVFQVMAERAALRQGMPPATPSYKTYIPCLILILLLIHDIYYIVSINLYVYSEELWWSFWALPELLAVFLFAVPGLVPERTSLASRAHGQESDAAEGS